MKWFDRWFARKCKQAWEESRKETYITLDEGPTNKVRASRELRGRNLSFNLYKANGGFVLECNRYDEKMDRHFSELYMVNDEDDFGKQVSQAITMESMKL